MKPRTPFGYAIFCDDIRQEVGNKVSIIGIYRGVASYGAEFPLTIPRFCIAVNWVQHREDEIKSIKLRVLFEDESEAETVVIEGDIPRDAFEQAPRDNAGDEMLHAFISIALSPLLVERQSKLKVRAYYGDEEYRLGSLRMVTAGADEASVS